MKKMTIALFLMILTSNAFATKYNCTSPNQRGSSVLTINEIKGAISITNTDWCGDFSAKYDATYLPRSLTDYLRFVAIDCSADGSTFVLLDKNILTEKISGKIKVQNRGESFENFEYVCSKI